MVMVMMIMTHATNKHHTSLVQTFEINNLLQPSIFSDKVGILLVVSLLAVALTHWLTQFIRRACIACTSLLARSRFEKRRSYENIFLLTSHNLVPIQIQMKIQIQIQEYPINRSLLSKHQLAWSRRLEKEEVIKIHFADKP